MLHNELLSFCKYEEKRAEPWTSALVELSQSLRKWVIENTKISTYQYKYLETRWTELCLDVGGCSPPYYLYQVVSVTRSTCGLASKVSLSSLEWLTEKSYKGIYIFSQSFMEVLPAGARQSRVYSAEILKCSPSMDLLKSNSFKHWNRWNIQSFTLNSHSLTSGR